MTALPIFAFKIILIVFSRALLFPPKNGGRLTGKDLARLTGKETWRGRRNISVIKVGW
jgi:hypothetical protein